MKDTTYVEREGRRILIRVLGSCNEARHLPDFRNKEEAQEYYNNVILIAQKENKAYKEHTKDCDLEIHDFDLIKYLAKEKRENESKTTTRQPKLKSRKAKG